MKTDDKNRLYVRVEGMYCEHCADTVALALEGLSGVTGVSMCGNIAEVVSVSPLDPEGIVTAIKNAGYETDKSKISTKRSRLTIKWYEVLGITAAIVLLTFLINKLFGYNIFNAIPAVDSGVSYGMLFVTGLLTSIHCVSMCGAIGIYASSEKTGARSLRRPILYNLGRVLSYTLIGGLVGLIGSVLSISQTLRGVIILIAAMLMFFMALSMLGIVDIRLPKLFNIKSRGRLGAFLMGLLNGLMPCGPLQAMQLYALSTGSFLNGALAMLLFALGTMPLMLASGALINLTRGKARAIIGKVASVLILVLSLSMLSRGLLALGMDVTRILPQKYEGYTAAVLGDGVQTVELELDYDSFGDIIVQKGVPVRVILHADKGKITGCNNETVSQDFGFDVKISPGDNVIEFTPSETGDYTFTCWMSMIRNRIKVIDDPGYFTKGGS